MRLIYMVTPIVTLLVEATRRHLGDGECVEGTSSPVENIYFWPALGRFSSTNHCAECLITEFTIF